METQYEISDDLILKCREFANKSTSTSSDKYARRGQSNVEKINNDIMHGKIGEEIAYMHLSKIIKDLSKPDYNIYESKDKNWDTDLKGSNIKIAVKTQDIQSEIHFSRSWVFQYGNGVYDCDSEVFKKTENSQYVCFVSINIPKRIAKIRAILNVNWLHKNNMFKEMKNPKLRSNKLAVYYSDLEKYEKELWQL